MDQRLWFVTIIPAGIKVPRDTQHPKQKEFFKRYDAFLRAALTSQPFLKNCQNGTFEPMHVIKLFGGQITSFEVLWKCHQVTLSKICLKSWCMLDNISILFITRKLSFNLQVVVCIFGQFPTIKQTSNNGKIAGNPTRNPTGKQHSSLNLLDNWSNKQY